MATHDTRSLEEMVERQIVGRGLKEEAVLRAMREVPRDEFVSEEMLEFAFEDAPLPIEAQQTISQPYMVALMTAELKLKPGESVLEVGTGSGYAAAVLSRIAERVYTIERHKVLADLARERFDRLGYDNIEVLHGDGTLGWPEKAPFDAIVVAAGGPDVPPSLKRQLAIGGRMVIPVGRDYRAQYLLRVTRMGDDEYRTEDLGRVAFVPLVGAEGWAQNEEESGGEGASGGAKSNPQANLNPGSNPTGNFGASAAATIHIPKPEGAVPALIHEVAEPFGEIEEADLEPLMERIGDAKVVLIGEASHGTSEFYRMRAWITRRLVERHGFNIVGLEADWPDAAQIDRYVRGLPDGRGGEPIFSRFPTWMWRNEETLEFVEWLREHNAGVADPEARTGFHGLDLYSMYASIDAVVRYLDKVDPEAAKIARVRYGCLSPWEADPAVYGQAAMRGRLETCREEVVAMLKDLFQRKMDYIERDGERYLDAINNARLIANAEEYYRVMWRGSHEGWNRRDRHMFETLKLLLEHRGEGARAVVWAHNSHIGNAKATEMGARGEINIGSLCRDEFRGAAYAIGFGTDRGTVAAASDWGGAMETKQVRPAHADSYERLCHDSNVPAFLFHMRHPRRAELNDELMDARLERAIGVIYRPQTELASHYFQAILPGQFDSYIWFDESEAVRPLTREHGRGMPETWPYGL